jgi:hypothetical protein
MVSARAPFIVLLRPVSGNATSAPTAVAKSAVPKAPSVRFRACRTAGMRDTQLAKPNPLRKKMAAIAVRAWDFEMGLEGILRLRRSERCIFERIRVLSSILVHGASAAAPRARLSLSGAG